MLILNGKHVWLIEYNMKHLVSSFFSYEKFEKPGCPSKVLILNIDKLYDEENLRSNRAINK